MVVTDSTAPNSGANETRSFGAGRGVVGVPKMFRCPNGHLGRIDADQESGAVSIICDSCDFHGFVDDGEVLSS